LDRLAAVHFSENPNLVFRRIPLSFHRLVLSSRPRLTHHLARKSEVTSVAAYGDGIASYGGALTLNQSTLTGNSCQQPGGGAIHVDLDSVVNVNQSTLTGNNAAGGGNDTGGIKVNAGLVTVSNSIVAGNTGIYPNLYSFNPATYPIAAKGVNLTNGNPLLAPLGHYGGFTQTTPPLPGSPAIDAGDTNSAYSIDQRGQPRIVNGIVDAGAVEGVFNPAFPLTGVTQLGDRSFQFGFTNLSGPSYTVRASTNVASSINTWSDLGAQVESPAGTFQFTDPQAPNYPQRFYRVSTP